MVVSPLFAFTHFTTLNSGGIHVGLLVQNLYKKSTGEILFDMLRLLMLSRHELVFCFNVHDTYATKRFQIYIIMKRCLCCVLAPQRYLSTIQESVWYCKMSAMRELWPAETRKACEHLIDLQIFTLIQGQKYRYYWMSLRNWYLTFFMSHFEGAFSPQHQMQCTIIPRLILTQRHGESASESVKMWHP